MKNTMTSVSTAAFASLCLLVLLPGSCAAAAPPPVLAVRTSPPTPAAGKPFTFTVTGSAINKLVESHERMLHAMALSSDLDIFAHIHNGDAAAKGGALALTQLTLPKSGRYAVAVDGATAQGPVSNHTVITVQGAPAVGPFNASRVGVTAITVKSLPLTDPQPVVSLASLLVPANSAAGGGAIYRATLSGPQGAACSPGQASQYVWTVERAAAAPPVAAAAGGAATFEPVTDFEEYLGAPMHVAVVSGDLSYAAHTHGAALKAGSGGGGVMIAPDAGMAGMAGMEEEPAAGAGGAADEHAGHTGRRRLLAASTEAQRPSGQWQVPGPIQVPRGQWQVPGEIQRPGGIGKAKARFGPRIAASIALPRGGVYALIGQLRRGRELLLLPFYVDCRGGR